jgi:hypothetical protein
MNVAKFKIYIFCYFNIDLSWSYRAVLTLCLQPLLYHPKFWIETDYAINILRIDWIFCVDYQLKLISVYYRRWSYNMWDWF